MKPIAALSAFFLTLTILVHPATGTAQTAYETTSVYVPMENGTRLAVDVHLPTPRPQDARLSWFSDCYPRRCASARATGCEWRSPVRTPTSSTDGDVLLTISRRKGALSFIELPVRSE